MELKEQIEKVVGAISNNPPKLEEFKKDPVAFVKKLLGAIPQDVIDSIVEGVKAKVKLDDAAGIVGKLGDMFKK